MCEQVFEVTFFCALILVCCEPGKTVIKQINSERVDTEQKHIETKIKFKTIDEEGIININLGDRTRLLILQVFK